MSLEQALKENTAAVIALIEVLKSSGAGVSADAMPVSGAEQPTGATPADAEADTPAEDATDLTDPEAPEGEPLTYEDVQADILKLVKEKGKPVALNLLKSFSAKHLREIDASKYGLVRQRVNALLAAE